MSSSDVAEYPQLQNCSRILSNIRLWSKLTGRPIETKVPQRDPTVQIGPGRSLTGPALWEGNREKTMAAPVTAVVAADLRFFEHFPRLFPSRAEMFRQMFSDMPEAERRNVAWDNAVLQMGYFIIALRAVGLDAGPMAGFERSVVDGAFFPDGRFASQYLINIGFADRDKGFPRLPRLPASDVAQYA